MNNGQTASKTWIPNERDLVLFLAGLEGISLFAHDCLMFYTEKRVPKELPDIWPWVSKGGNVTHLQWLTPQITDETIRELCQSLMIQSQMLDELNEQWNQTLATFLGLPMPRTESDILKLRKKLDQHRTKKGVDWVTRDEFQRLLSPTREISATSRDIWLRLHNRLQQVYPQLYGDLLLIREGFGDQRAKDIIDRAYEVDARSAIRLLKQALRYGRTGIQAHKAFEELGNRYKELGDTKKAIENYTHALEAWREPGWMTLYNRGELYYQQQRWVEALRDFERVLSLEWLPSLEFEQVKRYITEISLRKSE